MWARSGEELFYRNGDKMMVVDIAAEPTFTYGTPRLLFEGDYGSFGARRMYDVTADDERFLMVKTSQEGAGVSHLAVTLNWFEELKRLAPTDN